ncbi:NHLP leader peptide family natural product precursor [Paenibacillus sp. CAA11]|uniref:NHLP leader peptide family RiPP precursor n=1 Tax=Paenibacillus sp. CAA11 TaxID=1532905 RepID=UPI000D34F6E5|nr:NHLP leader peptide family RiPP precursor [Paenibacillus sp. CAA11]AWB43599.1 NHLP leader peptide family natural product precursor [Paenibacillus sp. CAA11]
MSTQGALLQSQVVQKAWQDPSFKTKLLSDPKAALQEFLGVELPDHIKVKAVEEQSDEFFIVLPPNPSKALAPDVKPLVMWN